jgi:hypothetical protein
LTRKSVNLHGWGYQTWLYAIRARERVENEPVLDDAREGLHVGTDILGDSDLFLVGGAFAYGAGEDLEEPCRVLGEKGLYE